MINFTIQSFQNIPIQSMVFSTFYSSEKTGMERGYSPSEAALITPGLSFT